MNSEQQNFFNYYQDRGMVKWNGFYLSEHTSCLHQQTEQKRKIPQRERLSSEDIQNVLATAIKRNQSIYLQKEEVDLDGNYGQDIMGKIDGYDELGIYIASQKIGYDEIRHAGLLENKKWHDTLL